MSAPEYIYTVHGDGYFDKFELYRIEIIKRGPKQTKIVASRGAGWHRRLDNEHVKRYYDTTAAGAIERWRKDTRKRIAKLCKEARHLERALKKTPREAHES